MTELGDVIHAASDSAAELCGSILNLEFNAEALESARSMESVHCVSVGLVNEFVAMQVGFTADVDGRDLLARSLLGFATNEVIEEQDVVDALAEIANILAGGVKTRLNHKFPALKLGLPIWTVLDPGLRQSSRIQITKQPLAIAGTKVVLTVLMENREKSHGRILS